MQNHSLSQASGLFKQVRKRIFQVTFYTSSLYSFLSSWIHTSKSVCLWGFLFFFVFFAFLFVCLFLALSIPRQKFQFYENFTRISNMFLIITSFHITKFAISLYLLINIFAHRLNFLKYQYFR